MCLGMRFAIAELKMTLATILSKLDIQTTKDPHTFTYIPSVTLQVIGDYRNEMKLEALTMWLSPASIAVSCVAVTIVYLVTPSAHDRAAKGLPTPDGDYPNLRQTIESVKFLDWILNYCRKYDGKPWYIRMLGRNPSIVCCPEAFENVQKTQLFDSFDKSPVVSKAMHDALGQGIFVISGPHHQRKTASHLFTAQMMQYAMEVVVPEKGETLMKRLNEFCEMKVNES
ncbi:Cytochrome P450 [Phytophthora megakarya]|uniref:Cytochrome P450 n=1 Tax=Phytophthora megakarya TaxID=4795 RepID=A0A225VSB9_9STRA|nr:Cytochrome P450 [Phytophthora megakarya]